MAVRVAQRTEPGPPSEPSPPSALPTLTALRFAAAALVFLTHADPDGPLAAAGRSGVSFFFVLSGCVLAWSTGVNVRRRTFWRRRAARLLPAYLVAWLAGSLVTAWESGWPAALDLPTLPGWLLVQAWFPAADVHFAVNGVSWSLSCELFFYLVFPWLFAGLYRLGRTAVLAVGLGALLVAMTVPTIVRSGNPNYFWIYVFPPTRLIEFLVGIAVGILLRKGVRCPIRLSWALFVAASAWVAAVFGPVWSASVAITVVPWTLVIMAAASADLRRADLRRADLRRADPVIRWRWLVRLGELSYAFYLVHQLVLRTLTVSGWDGDEGVYLGVGFVLSLIAAAGLHTLVERPARRVLLGPRRRPALIGP